MTGADTSPSQVLDELRRSRLGIEHARLRLAVLAATGDVLASALDFPDAVDALGGVLVPDLADAALLDLRRPHAADHRWRWGPVLGADADGAAHPHPDGDRLVERVLTEGVTVVLMATRRAAAVARPGRAATVAAAPAPEVESMVIVPVAGRERPAGALTLVTAPGRRGLRPSDLDTAHAVAQRIAAAAERQRMLEQLRQSERLEAVAQLAAGVAHDFNNLLTVILGSTEAAQRRLDEAAARPAWADALRDDITAVDRAGQRAAALTAQLLDLAAPASAPLEELDPDEVVLALLPALGQLVGSSVVVEHRPAHPEVRIRAERTGLERALLNLAANARDAMPSGGRLTISSIAPAEPRSESVGLAVADTGTGMDEDTAARCFEPFFTTKERSRGTGLGLAGVASFVAGAGGDVMVETAAGAGCTLTMWFPVGSEDQGSKR